MAIEDGTIVSVGEQGAWGNRVVIRHADGHETTYNHLSKFGVKEGDKVKAGQVIAKSGNSGNSTGPHLDIEVMVNGERVDPSKFYDFGGVMSVATAGATDWYAGSSASGRKGSGSGSSSSAGGLASLTNRGDSRSQNLQAMLEAQQERIRRANTANAQQKQTQNPNALPATTNMASLLATAQNPFVLPGPRQTKTTASGRAHTARTTQRAATAKSAPSSRTAATTPDPRLWQS